MLKLRRTSAYKRGYKLVKKRGYDIALLNEAIDLLLAGQKLPPRYRDHALRGQFTGLRECHIEPDWLLLYLIENDVLTLTLVETGTHADIFG